MAKYVKIQPSETVDAIQLRRYWQIERYYHTPFPKEYESQPSIGKDCPFIPAGSWIVDDGTKQYILSDIEFQQRFRRVGEPQPFAIDPAISGKDYSGRVRICRKCGQVVESK